MIIEDAISADRVHHQWQPDIVFAEKTLIDETAKKFLKTDTLINVLIKTKIFGQKLVDMFRQ